MKRWIMAFAYSVIGFGVAVAVAWILSIKLGSGAWWVIYCACAGTAVYQELNRKKNS